jgi:small ligand-binding sensory domain FIST
VRGARGVVAVSRGVQKLGPILTVSAVHGHDVIATDGQPALTRLLRELPLDWRGQERPPWHSLFAAVLACDTPDALAEGCYELIPVIAGSDSGVTLSASIAPGTRIAWCLRQPIAAERDTRVALRRAAAELGERPGFAVVFSCIGRGPYFFGGVDRDLEIARSLWPGTPMIGVYGAGEIAPLPMGNRVIHNGAVFVAYASEQR